jgi:hypothetical protein
MKCVICHGEVEEWPGGGGFGNNPDPWPRDDMLRERIRMNVGDDNFRCCRWCNQNIIVPLRLGSNLRGVT